MVRFLELVWKWARNWLKKCIKTFCKRPERSQSEKIQNNIGILFWMFLLYFLLNLLVCKIKELGNSLFFKKKSFSLCLQMVAVGTHTHPKFLWWLCSAHTRRSVVHIIIIIKSKGNFFQIWTCEYKKGGINHFKYLLTYLLRYISTFSVLKKKMICLGYPEYV